MPCSGRFADRYFFFTRRDNNGNHKNHAASHVGKGRLKVGQSVTSSSSSSTMWPIKENRPTATEAHYRLCINDGRTADAEFLLAKRRYVPPHRTVRGVDDVIAWHRVRQSSAPSRLRKKPTGWA